MIKKERSACLDLALALTLNLCFLAVLLHVYSPYFHSNDDFVLMQLVNGTYGFNEFRLVYINVVLGSILKLLYVGLPNFPWYALLQYFFIFCSFTLLCWVLIRRWKPVPALLIFALLLSFFGIDAYILIHYTKTAAILTLAGLFLMFQAIYESGQTLRISLTVVGTMLALFGMMYRSMQFFACGIVVCFIIFEFLLPCLAKRKSDYKEALLYAGKTLRPFALLLIFAAVLSCVDKAAYLDDDWAYYKEYNTARTEVMDYGKLPDYNEAAAAYSTLGISESMAKLLPMWDFLDTELLDKDAFAALAEIDSASKPVLSKGIEYIRELLHDWACYGFVMSAAVWLLFGRHDKTAWAAVLCAGGAYVFMCAYMVFTGRYNIYWVDYSQFLAMSMLLLWFVPRQDGRHCIKAVVLAVAVSGILFAVYFPGWNLKFSKASNEQYPEYQALIEKIKEDEHLFISDVYFYDLAYICESPFSTEREFSADNLLVFGGWQAMYPPLVEGFARYGVENPYRDCVNNEAVYLLTSHIDLTLEHIRERYYPEAEALALMSPHSNMPYGVYKIIG